MAQGPEAKTLSSKMLPLAVQVAAALGWVPS